MPYQKVVAGFVVLSLPSTSAPSEWGADTLSRTSLQLLLYKAAVPPSWQEQSFETISGFSTICWFWIFSVKNKNSWMMFFCLVFFYKYIIKQFGGMSSLPPHAVSSSMPVNRPTSILWIRLYTSSYHLLSSSHCRLSWIESQHIHSHLLQSFCCILRLSNCLEVVLICFRYWENKKMSFFVWLCCHKWEWSWLEFSSVLIRNCTQCFHI